ncbi:MAG: helix-turn-helix transcriptional regulator [Clostridia bacterium]|nr:helix-turn-helix transcriptional regulator [Clostridia bacterium]
MTLSEKLYTLRKSKGLSQEALAEAIGVSRQAISKWENGSAVPESDKLIALARYFAVSLDELIGAQPPVAQAEEDAPAARQDSSRPVRLAGLILCLVGVLALVVWGILQFLAPDTSKDIAASSVIMLDGNAILFLLCVAAVAVGAALLLKGLQKK